MKKYLKYLLPIILSVCLFLPAYSQTPYRNQVEDIGISKQGLVLHLPFHAYGGEQTKIRDISGNNNHGTITGAVPASYPMLSGTELVSNGGMESGDPPTGFSNFGSCPTFESSGTQKHSGSKSLHYISNGTSGKGVSKNLSSQLAQGKTYKFCIWRYTVVDDINNSVISLRKGDNSDNEFSEYPTWVVGSWAYWEKIWTVQYPAGASTALREITFANGAENFVDDISVQEVVGYEGLGWGFDGVGNKVDCGTFIFAPANFTILHWINIPSPTPAYNGLIGNHSDSISGFVFYTSPYSTNLSWTLQLSVSGAKNGSVAAPYYGNYFLHGLVYDGSNLYGIVNNVLSAPTAGTGSLVQGNYNLQIGKNGNSNYSLLIVGETLVFTRALSAQEIRDYYELSRRRYGIDARDILIKHAEEFEYAMAA